MVIKQENRNVLRLIFGFALLLAFLFTINPLSRTALGIYLFLLVVGYLFYNSSLYQKDLIGISKNNIGKVLGLSVFIAGIYYLTTKFVPGLSFGIPLLPGAISDQLKFFIIVFVAPICEEIFFRGALLAYIRNFSPSKRQVIIAIVIQAVFFSLFHLGAYISGFYNYPDIPSVLLALGANVSAFIVAFIFGILAGTIVTRNGVRNLWFSIFLHIFFNFIVYQTLTVALF